MNFVELLQERAEQTKSMVCVGLDPMLERIPITSGSVKERIEKFFLGLLDAFVSEGVEPAMIKPNIAFYEQYGFEGLQALKTIIAAHQKKGTPVILDAKRGDIGKTSEAYAKALFEFWNADAITVAPYMGSDSVQPFLDYCKKGKGVYVLVRTSNKGAQDFQDLPVFDSPIYTKVAEKLVDWFCPGIGAVVGATYPIELEKLSTFFVNSGKEIPLLIPGVGSQGGSASDIVHVLKKTGNPLALHLINSSSGITYAYEKQQTDDYAGAAVKAMKELQREIEL